MTQGELFTIERPAVDAAARRRDWLVGFCNAHDIHTEHSRGVEPPWMALIRFE